MLTRPQTHPVPWPQERIGYTHETTVAYAPGDTQKMAKLNLTAGRKIGLERRIGGVLLTAGALWGGYEAVHNATLMALLQDIGPLEISAAGLLLRLHAKWQRSTKLL
jgi:hypothetical protein